MKLFKFWAVCLFSVLACINVTSCSSDDDPSSLTSPNSLVGTWKLNYDNDTYSNLEEYVMCCKDGIAYDLILIEKCNPEVGKGEYSYNEKAGTVTIYNVYHRKTLIYNVVSMTDNKIVMKRESDGVTITFVKATSPYTESELEKLSQEQHANSNEH